jgi:hypothetical protein
MFRLDVPANRSREKRQPHQLPPGRHGLPRSFVVSNQRERILSDIARNRRLSRSGSWTSAPAP